MQTHESFEFCNYNKLFNKRQDLWTISTMLVMFPLSVVSQVNKTKTENYFRNYSHKSRRNFATVIKYTLHCLFEVDQVNSEALTSGISNRIVKPLYGSKTSVTKTGQGKHGPYQQHNFSWALKASCKFSGPYFEVNYYGRYTLLTNIIC